MPKAGRLAKQLDKAREEGKTLPPWAQHAPKQVERQTASKIRQIGKSTGLRAKKKA